MHRIHGIGVAVVAVAAIGACSGCGGGGSAPARTVTTMSRNLYLGAELGGAIGAVMSGDPDAIVTEVTLAWADVAATDFATRAEALADEIAAARPDVVGLQEAALWRTQSPSDAFTAPTPATTVAFDFVEMLRAALAARGLAYDVVAEVAEADFEMPAMAADLSLFDVRFTDRDVLLARAGLAADGIVLTNPQSGLFDAFLDLGGGLVIPRGWVAVDVEFAGAAVRFVSTHLEDGAELVQLAQAEELLAGPLAGTGEAVLLGDLNSDANAAPSGATYAGLLASGFADAWLEAGMLPGTGATWGHDDALLDPLADLDQRLDVVLFRGALVPEAVDVVGEDPLDMFGGLWPSDHAGVVVTLRR